MERNDPVHVPVPDLEAGTTQYDFLIRKSFTFRTPKETEFGVLGKEETEPNVASSTLALHQPVSPM